MEELNRLEAAIMERLSSVYLDIKLHLPYLKVKNRQNYENGMDVNLCYDKSEKLLKPVDIKDGPIGSGEIIKIKEIEIEIDLGYVVFIEKGKILLLELWSYFPDEWDGTFEDFTFEDWIPDPLCNLKDLVTKFGSREAALKIVQDAANQALKDGKLTPDADGKLSYGLAGDIINVCGLNVRLHGGKVVDGEVILDSITRT